MYIECYLCLAHIMNDTLNSGSLTFPSRVGLRQLEMHQKGINLKPIKRRVENVGNTLEPYDGVIMALAHNYQPHATRSVGY